MNVARKLKLEVVTSGEEIKRSPSSDKLATYFYRIVNHDDLFKIGKGYLGEVKKGVKNFAFSSIGYKASQQKTILGLCCFFDQNSDSKIAIISDNMSLGVFSDLLESSTSSSYSAGNEGDVINYKTFHHHFDFIDYAEFAKFYDNHLYTKSFDTDVTKILEKYDIVLWDVPAMEDMKKNSHFHYRISHFYESMTVILSQMSSSGKEIESIKKFFSNYNVRLNGVLFEVAENEERSLWEKMLRML